MSLFIRDILWTGQNVAERAAEQLSDKSVTGRTPQLSSAHNRKPQFKVSSLRKQNFVATRIVVLIPRSRGRGRGDHRRRITIDVWPPPSSCLL